MPEETSVDVQVELPVIGQLLRHPVKAGKVLLFLFDPDSQWPMLVLNMTVGFVQKGIDVLYVVTSRTPSEVRADLRRRGVDPTSYEQEERLVLSDAFTPKTGKTSPEKYSIDSLNVADISIASSKALDQWPIGSVRIFENVSELVENSDEKAFMKFYRTWTARLVTRGRIVIDGFVRGVHSEPLYKSVMAIADGVLELSSEEIAGNLENVIRVRSFKGLPVDTSKYVLRLQDDLTLSLEKI